MSLLRAPFPYLADSSAIAITADTYTLPWLTEYQHRCLESSTKFTCPEDLALILRLLVPGIPIMEGWNGLLFLLALIDTARKIPHLAAIKDVVAQRMHPSTKSTEVIIKVFLSLS
jgi:hypothetical protein